MKKGYVILRKGYEYDDSIYEAVDGGAPTLVCFTIEDAKSKVKMLNIKEYKSVSIRDYTYNIEDLIVDIDKFREFNKSLVSKYGPIETKYSWEDTTFKLHPDADLEESEKYASMVDMDFFEYVETDLDMESYRDDKINDILK